MHGKSAQTILIATWLYLQVPPDCLQLQARMTPRPSLSNVQCPEPEEAARFTEELQAKAKADACATRRLVACNFHAKSKHVSGGERKWRSHSDADKQEYIRASVWERRQTISTRQCLERWIRSAIADASSESAFGSETA